jgi:HK97 family phage prohead protease
MTPAEEWARWRRLRRLGIRTPLPQPHREAIASRTAATVQRPDRPVVRTLTRTFAIDTAEVSGRTVEAKVVPYGVIARVADPPDYTPYDERFARGSFARQAGATKRARVLLDFEHERGIGAIVGHDLKLEETRDGLHGTFTLHRNNDGDKALELIQLGILTGLSVEAKPLRSRRVDGVVERVEAYLDKVALCRSPAYPDAQVLAVRTAR